MRRSVAALQLEGPSNLMTQPPAPKAHVVEGLMLGCSKLMAPILRFVDAFLGTEMLARNSTILRLLFAEDTRCHAEMANVVNTQP